MDRYGHDRRAALEREPSHPRPRALPDFLGAGAPALGVDHDHAATLEDRERRLHRLLVVVAATHWERSTVAHHPPEHPAEEL